MRSKLVVLLVSPHFQRVKTIEPLLIMMKWARGWWLFIFSILSTNLKSCILYFLFYFISLMKHFSLFYPGKKPFLDCKQNVGARIDTLMSISDGLGPSIFCRKMEKARPMREEIDRKVVCLPPESSFWLRCSNFYSTFPYLYLDLACEQLCFAPEIGTNRTNESTDLEPFYHPVVLMIFTSIDSSTITRL